MARALSTISTRENLGSEQTAMSAMPDVSQVGPLESLRTIGRRWNGRCPGPCSSLPATSAARGRHSRRDKHVVRVTVQYGSTGSQPRTLPREPHRRQRATINLQEISTAVSDEWSESGLCAFTVVFPREGTVMGERGDVAVRRSAYVQTTDEVFEQTLRCRNWQDLWVVVRHTLLQSNFIIIHFYHLFQISSRWSYTVTLHHGQWTQLYKCNLRGANHSFDVTGSPGSFLTRTTALPHVFLFSKATRASTIRSSGQISEYITGLVRPDANRLHTG